VFHDRGEKALLQIYTR